MAWKRTRSALSGARIVAFALVSWLILASSGTPQAFLGGTGSPAVAAASLGQDVLVVHFIDVGQGDAILLQKGETAILIDAGTHLGDEVVPYLQGAKVKALDLLIATHPHADHIGQMDRVLKTFPVREVWMSGNLHTSRVFERVVDALLASDAGYHEPRRGEVVDVGGLRLEVLNPGSLTGHLNDDSIVLRVVHGQVFFLFTGDAEAAAEETMLKSGRPLRAHVLKLGHHGSRTSTSDAFLQAVAPEVAVYSAGLGNLYGHPHREVLARLRQFGVRVYGTDRHGTIRVFSDGETYWVEPERDGPPGSGENSAAAGSGTGLLGCAPGQIDINSASVEELTAIVHIGPARARELVALRPFQSLADLTRLRGIGEARLKDIEEEGLACVGP